MESMSAENVDFWATLIIIGFLFLVFYLKSRPKGGRAARIRALARASKIEAPKNGLSFALMGVPLLIAVGVMLWVLTL